MAIKYKWLAGRLEKLIDTRIRQGIEKLPPEQELCMRYGVSRQTVRSALALLEKQGLITRRQGSGSFITGLSSKPEKNTVGLLLYSAQEYMYPGVINDVKNALAPSGFSLKVFATENRIQTERQILEQLLESPPRGIIVHGCQSALPNPNLELFRRLIQKGCPVVFFYNRYAGLGDCPYVKDDNRQGSSLLVRHLADQGHTAIGGIFKSDEQQGLERYSGFMDTMYALGLSVPDERVGWYNSRNTAQLIRGQAAPFLWNMIRESLSSCTAVICYNDYLAYFLIRELKRAGYTLPGDIAIAAFDNTYLSESDILTVTTLDHQPHEMGTRAARLLLQKIKGLPVASEEVPWKLYKKESTRG